SQDKSRGQVPRLLDNAARPIVIVSGKTRSEEFCPGPVIPWQDASSLPSGPCQLDQGQPDTRIVREDGGWMAAPGLINHKLPYGVGQTPRLVLVLIGEP